MNENFQRNLNRVLIYGEECLSGGMEKRTLAMLIIYQNLKSEILKNIRLVIFGKIRPTTDYAHHINKNREKIEPCRRCTVI